MAAGTTDFVNCAEFGPKSGRALRAAEPCQEVVERHRRRLSNGIRSQRRLDPLSIVVFPVTGHTRCSLWRGQRRAPRRRGQVAESRMTDDVIFSPVGGAVHACVSERLSVWCRQTATDRRRTHGRMQARHVFLCVFERWSTSPELRGDKEEAGGWPRTGGHLRDSHQQ